MTLPGHSPRRIFGQDRMTVLRIIPNLTAPDPAALRTALTAILAR